MEHRAKRLEQVLIIRNKDIQTAEAALTNARLQFQQYKIQHEQLIYFRQEYMEQLNLMGKDGCALANMRNRVDFISQLDRALSHMNQELAQLAKVRTEAEKRYIKAKQQEEVLERLIKRIDQGEVIKENKQQQKESDEQAQKQWYSSHMSSSSMT